MAKFERIRKLNGAKCACGAQVEANIASIGAHLISQHNASREDAYLFAQQVLKTWQKENWRKL